MFKVSEMVIKFEEKIEWDTAQELMSDVRDLIRSYGDAKMDDAEIEVNG